MTKAIPSEASRLFYGALATPGMPEIRQFRLEQSKLDRLLELRAEIEALRFGRGREPLAFVRPERMFRP